MANDESEKKIDDGGPVSATFIRLTAAKGDVLTVQISNITHVAAPTTFLLDNASGVQACIGLVGSAENYDFVVRETPAVVLERIERALLLSCRLRLAGRAAEGLAASSRVHTSPQAIAKTAIAIADALIAEGKK